MLALITRTPAAVLAGASAFVVAVACRAIVACWLALAAMRTAPPDDLTKVLRATREILDTAFRLKR